MSFPELTENQQMIRETVRALAEKHFRPKAAEVDRSAGRRQERQAARRTRIYRLVHFRGIWRIRPGAPGGDSSWSSKNWPAAAPTQALLAGTTEGAAPRAIFYLGNETQRRALIPKLKSGEFYCGWGMSEPNAGSDLGSMQCKAVRSGNEYIVNGTKMWCTAAQIAEIFVVFVRLTPIRG